MKTSIISKDETKTIEIKDDLIIYTLANDGISDYFSYNETLVGILNQKGLSPFRDSGRLRFTYKGRNKYYCYDIAMACYSGKVNTKTFVTDMESFQNYKKRNGYDIDHADTNCQNNTKYNLSIMDRQLNQRKHSITARFVESYAINTAFVEGSFRIQICTRLETKKAMQSLYNLLATVLSSIGVSLKGLSEYMEMNQLYICKTANDFVSCLKRFYNTKYPELGIETPRIVRAENKDASCWSDDIERSIREQQRLAVLPVEEFQIYKEFEN